MSTNPPQWSAGNQPQYRMQEKKSTSPLVWILAAVGVFFVLVIIAVVGFGYFIVNKAKQAGVDPDLMKRNPALASVKVMAALNHDIEVLSMDEQAGKVKVRNRKTGKTYEVDFDDAKRGHFTVQEDGKQEVVIGSQGDKDNGSFELKSGDSVVKIGGGAGVKTPAWVPNYPGSDPQGTFSARNSDGDTGSIAFKTSASLEKVAQFYVDEFKSEGMKTSSTVSNSDGTGSAVVHAEAREKTAVVVLGTEGGQTAVSITFKSRK